MMSLHFEYENNKVICTLDDAEDGKKSIKADFKDLSEAVSNIREILESEGYISAQNELSAIVARVVAPSDYLAEDRIVDDEFMQELEAAKERAPLHVPVVAAEIKHLRAEFPKTKIISISDSAFHWNRPEITKYYAFDTDLADKASIKRYGYHGISVSYITETMKSENIIPEKLIVCHLGSGSSISAVLNGKAMDNSMGYSPLEGLMMSTRSGTLDVAAAFAVKRELGFTDDTELEKYLNKKAGLLGVSGSTDDMRQIIQKRDEGDPKATFAHALFVHKVQANIALMTASLGGADAIVFTATIGERSDEIRRYVSQKLSYLGFRLDEEKNKNPEFTGKYALISSTDSKPIYIIPTNETSEMIRKASVLLDAVDADAAEG